MPINCKAIQSRRLFLHILKYLRTRKPLDKSYATCSQTFLNTHHLRLTLALKQWRQPFQKRAKNIFVSAYRMKAQAFHQTKSLCSFSNSYASSATFLDQFVALASDCTSAANWLRPWAALSGSRAMASPAMGAASASLSPLRNS